jgi:hypothetical protein
VRKGAEVGVEQNGGGELGGALHDSNGENVTGEKIKASWRVERGLALERERTRAFVGESERAAAVAARQ